jgi:hypothetical protein
MKRVVVKILLNPDNHLDAKLIAALKQVKNKSAHLKLAAYFYWDILRPGGQIKLPLFELKESDLSLPPETCRIH